MHSPKSLIATQTTDGYKLAKSWTSARINPRPVAHQVAEGTGAPGASGGPVFDESGQVVAQNARSDVANNRRSGPAIEHLNEVLRQVRLHQPYEGILDVKSRVETFQNDAGKSEVSLPINVTSTATVLNNETLARKAQQRWKANPEHYPKSQDLGAYRFFAMPAASDLTTSAYSLTSLLATNGSTETDDNRKK